MIAGVILTLMPVFFTLLTRAVCPTTKDELVKDLSTFRKPRYDDLYAITIMLLIQVRGFG